MNIYAQISQNKLKTFVLFFIFIGFFTLLFYVIGRFYGNSPVYFILGLLIASSTSILSYFYSDKIVLAMAGAKPAKKEEFFDFYTTAENISIAAGIPMPKLYVINDQSPNAFATGRDPEHAVIVATTGLLKSLKRSEIEGVIAHEISHIKNYDMLLMTIVAVMVGTIMFVIDSINRTILFGGINNNDNNKSANILSFIGLIILLTVGPIIASIIQFAISRRREFLADASAALLTRNPNGLADALEKISSYKLPLRNVQKGIAHLYIENPLKESSKFNFLEKLFSTHPPVEERIKILRSM